MDAQSGKVLWKIKKDDFLNGSFEDAKFQLDVIGWQSSSGRYRFTQYIFLLTGRSSSSLCNLGKHITYGGLTLSGFSEDYTITRMWDCYNGNLKFTFDSARFSFDDIYLFPDGTYHFVFKVHHRNLIVGFTSSNHALILGPENNACLEIENHAIFVSKSYLAAVSPYFKALFYSDFKEKNEEVITLKQVKLDIFRQFLAHLYRRFSSCVDVDKIPEVLQLADMFLCVDVKYSCELFLIEKKVWTVADLKLADTYSLPCLRYKLLRVLPIADLKTYLGTILDDASCELSRHRIIERIQREAPSR